MGQPQAFAAWPPGNLAQGAKWFEAIENARNANQTAKNAMESYPVP